MDGLFENYVYYIGIKHILLAWFLPNNMVEAIWIDAFI